jgi:hypothetical protein
MSQYHIVWVGEGPMNKLSRSKRRSLGLIAAIAQHKLEMVHLTVIGHRHANLTLGQHHDQPMPLTLDTEEDWKWSSGGLDAFGI